jgi:hypothetical protein
MSEFLQQVFINLTIYRLGGNYLCSKFYIATIQPTTQNKTKQLGWCGIIISKKKHHHTTPPHRNDYILSRFQAT